MRRGFRLAAVVLLLFGGWQLAAGGWIHAKAALAQTLMAASWDRMRAGADKARPWPWADTWPVARLRSPRLGVDTLVLAGDSGRTLAFGPGLVGGTALPGEPGMSVIIGHRDTSFRFLRDLLPGDALRVTGRDGRTREYIVQGRRVVHKDKALLAMDRDGLTLVTCYPFDAVAANTPLRYVVLAEPASDHSPATISSAW